MSGAEIVVIVGGLVAGYVFVWAMLETGSKRGASAHKHQAPGAAQGDPGREEAPAPDEDAPEGPGERGRGE